LLLSDEEHKVIESFGAWGKKKLYGKEYYGTIRSTFLIDPHGHIVKEWKKVKVKGHVEDVLENLIKIKSNKGRCKKMENKKELVLKAFEKAGKPLRPGDIAKETGIDSKEVSKIIKELKKEGKIDSPKRCYYAPTGK
jgi:peroxiredoxin Q/BCP